MRDRRAALVLAGLVGGAALGFAVDALTAPVYRATVVLAFAPGPGPRETEPDAEPLPADTLAETYAEFLSERSFLDGIAPRVAGGRRSAGELADRLDVRHPPGAATVELTAEEKTAREAETVALDVASAVLALADQLARQRAGGDAGVTLAAAPLSDEVTPRRWENRVGGLLLGLVCGLGAAMLRRRAREVRIVAPAPRSVVRGAIDLRAEAAPGSALDFLASDGSPVWRSVGSSWNTRDVADGVWWLTAVARDSEGRATLSEPLPVVVRNQGT